jgi:hypothetical protein
MDKNTILLILIIGIILFLINTEDFVPQQSLPPRIQITDQQLFDLMTNIIKIKRDEQKNLVMYTQNYLTNEQLSNIIKKLDGNINSKIDTYYNNIKIVCNNALNMTKNLNLNFNIMEINGTLDLNTAYFVMSIKTPQINNLLLIIKNASMCNAIYNSIVSFINVISYVQQDYYFTIITYRSLNKLDSVNYINLDKRNNILNVGQYIYKYLYDMSKPKIPNMLNNLNQTTNNSPRVQVLQNISTLTNYSTNLDLTINYTIDNLPYIFIFNCIGDININIITYRNVFLPILVVDSSVKIKITFK